MNDGSKVPLAKNESGGLTAADAAAALASAVSEAGKLALSMSAAGFRTWKKEFDSPVTEADIAVDALLRERLQALAPAYGWQSEESMELPGRTAHERRWVVDPIDGTRSFIKKLPDWCIAAALVEHGRPIAAALHAPVRGELFVAIAGGGVTRNGRPIAASNVRSLAAARIAGPRFMLDRLLQSGTKFEIAPRIHSLALRFACVAGGEIDAAIASERSRDWDLAAADLLVHEAGGVLTTVADARIDFERPDAEHPALVAAGLALHPALIAAIREIPTEK
jgi:myo-inositol-1(or 4)-monophosphatase